MTPWIAGSLFLAAFLAAADAETIKPLAKSRVEEPPGPGKEPPGPGKAPPGPGKKGNGKGEAGPGASGAEAKAAAKEPPAPVSRARPQLKAPQATEKLQEGLRKMEARDYGEARVLFNGCLKDAATPEDRKLLLALVDDTKLGSEIEAARGMAEHKEERKAIARVEKALKTYPQSELRPAGEKFIRETEEVLYLILDDFEPGESLQRETEGKEEEPGPDVKKTPPPKGSPGAAVSRWRKNQSFNSDPRFVKHGKGSMKWRIGGDYYNTLYWGGYGYGYLSAELKNPITKWRQLVFSVFMPEADDGRLQVTLAPDDDMGILRSLYTKKFVELKGKRGWMEVRLDLARDFGNTQNIKLEDVRYIRIHSLQPKFRTIYLDFVHLE